MKKAISILMLLVVCFGLLPSYVYAENSDIVEVYQRAVQATTASGSWTETLALEADMTIQNDRSKIKTKATLNSSMDVSGYSENDLSNLRVSGSADMSVLTQTYSWDLLYEDGVAHYEYTQPNQTTMDIPMDASDLYFNTFTQNIFKDANLSGNTITFKVAGNQMESAGIAAVHFMPGIDNLHYGDATVEVVTDESTKAIHTMIITVHASMTYQGYNAEVDYKINYEFSNFSNPSVEQTPSQEQPTAIADGFVIYSDYVNLSVPKENVITLSAGIFVDGKQLEDPSGIVFWVEDSSILTSKSTGISNHCRYVKLEAIADGSTNVCFSDSNTGYVTKVPVTVYTNHHLSYSLSSVPPEKYVEKKYPTNFYNVNGLYIDSYQYQVNDDGSANVSFDVYNTNYTYGAVEVFDGNGEMQQAVLINKITKSNTSIKDSVWDNTGYLIRDFFDGDFLTYRQESGYSKHTPVSVKIPQNGYLKISTDPQNSFIVNFVNSADILLSIGSLVGEIKNLDFSSSVFCEELTWKLVQETAYAELLKDGSQMPQKLWENVGKEVLVSPESLVIFTDTIVNNIESLDLEDVILDTATDVGIGISEDVVKFFFGDIGKVLDGLFTFAKFDNIMSQCNSLIDSTGVGSIYIQNQGGGLRSSQQIKVTSEHDFPESTSLNVFQVNLDPDRLDLVKKISPSLYETIKQGTSYTYDISLLDNGEEVQPDGEMTVHIPIPNGLKQFAYIGCAKIFHIGEDGQATEMDVDIENDCFVFKTDHFSIYTIVGSSRFLPLKTVLSVCTIVILLLVFLLSVRRIKNNVSLKANLLEGTPSDNAL